MLLGLGCVVVSWFDHFRTPASRPYRALMFVGLGLSGVIPVLHGLSFCGYRQLDERMGLSWVLLQGGLYIFGAFLYAVSIWSANSQKEAERWLICPSGSVSRAQVARRLRHLGKLAPDFPCLCPAGGGVALIRHGQGVRLSPQRSRGTVLNGWEWMFYIGTLWDALVT